MIGAGYAAVTIIAIPAASFYKYFCATGGGE